MPKLRFSEFTHAWEERKLGEIMVEGRLGGNYENSESNDGHPVIKMGNLGRGTINLDKIQYLPEGKEYNKEDVLQDGDLLFNTRNTLELVGKVSIWRNELPFALYNSNLMRMKFDQSIDASNRFMNYLFNTKKSINQLRSFATGTTSVAAIYGRDLKRLRVKFPSIEEQYKIASFISKVDEKIEKLEKKQELWETYKTGMMQQIFSQKLRFKDENGGDYPDWEEKKLGDILNVKYGKDYKHLDYGNIPVLGTGGVMTYVNEFLYDKPSLLIGRKGTINKPIFINEPFWTVDTLFYTEIYGSNPKFTFYLASIINWLKYNEASGVPSLSAENIKKIPIELPSSNEQRKIANFISSIDSKIEQLDKELNITREFKKGLLQQMFC